MANQTRSGMAGFSHDVAHQSQIAADALNFEAPIQNYIGNSAWLHQKHICSKISPGGWRAEERGFDGLADQGFGFALGQCIGATFSSLP